MVCKNCGAEVSPYVTECPYCGTRLRKRAPKLERRGDELLARETRSARRQRRAAERRARRPRLAFAADRPYVTLAAILGPAVLLVVQRAGDISVFQLGVVQAGVGVTDWWQYLAAPFVYDDLGYLFTIALGDGAVRALPGAAPGRRAHADPPDRLRGARGAGGPGARRRCSATASR